jgi:hypothetical protein
VQLATAPQAIQKRSGQGVIVGERMPPAYLQRLMEIVKEQFGEIPVRTARRSSDRYTLNIE